MNPDQPSREELELRITALLLGELSDDEAASLRAALASDPALKQFHDEMAATIGLVRETVKTPAEATAENAAPLQLAEEKRQKLLAHFKTPRPGESFWIKPMKLEMPRLITVLAVVAIIAVLAAMMLPALSKAKSRSMRANTTLGLATQKQKEDYAYIGELNKGEAPPVNSAPPPAPMAAPAAATPPGQFSETVTATPTPGQAVVEPESSKLVVIADKKTEAPLANTLIVLPPTEQPAQAAVSSKSLADLSDADSRKAPSQVRATSTVTPITDVNFTAAPEGTSQPISGGSIVTLTGSGGTSPNAPVSGYSVHQALTEADRSGSPLQSREQRQLQSTVGGDFSLMQSSGGASGGGGGGQSSGAVVGIVNAYAGGSGLRNQGIGGGGGSGGFGGFAPGFQNQTTALNQNLGVAKQPIPRQLAEQRITGENTWSSSTAGVTQTHDLAWSDDLSRRQAPPAIDSMTGLPIVQPPSVQPPASADSFEQAPARNVDTQAGMSTQVPKGASQLRNGAPATRRVRDFNGKVTPLPGARTAVTEAETTSASGALDKTVSAESYLEQPGQKDVAANSQPTVLGDIPQTGHMYRSVNANPQPAPATTVNRPVGGTTFNSFDGSTRPPVVIANPNVPSFDTPVQGGSALSTDDINGLRYQLSTGTGEAPALQPQQTVTVNNGTLATAAAKPRENPGPTIATSPGTSAVVPILDASGHVVDVAYQNGTDGVVGGVSRDGSTRDANQSRLNYVTQITAASKISAQARSYFSSLGIDLNNPPGQAVFYNDRAGILLVRSTKKDLEAIAHGLDSKAKTSDFEAQLATEETVNQDGSGLFNGTFKIPNGADFFQVNTDQGDQPVAKVSVAMPIPQPETLVRENAFSTFSMNVSDVSYKLAQASLEQGHLPDAAGIRSEEFINAFDYRDPEAAMGKSLAFASERARYPFAQNRELLRFSVKTAAAGRPAGRALNLVLLLDNSGSMERADRVAIIREALRVLTTQLQPGDTVSVVTFARTARLWADGIPGDKAADTLEKVGEITPEGGTNLEEAMRLAYETARRHYLANGMNRVVLLTDGAANLGNVAPSVLREKVEAERKQGIALDCFGIGFEDYDDDLLEQLSSHGDGRYAFLDSPEDVTQEFAAKLAGALQIAASDVKVQVEFNPDRVTSYRQIGYAKHQLTKEQFRDNTVNAAQIAAQEAGNALYTVETKPDGTGPVATVRVRYRVPGTADYHEWSWEVPYEGVVPPLENASPAMRLAGTASAFSEWLAQSPYAQEVSPDELLKILSGVPEVYGADERPKKLEWMIRQAQSLSGK